MVPTWRSPHGTGSMFATDPSREAWEARRALIADYLEPPVLPGRRPYAWWEFEADRPQYLTETNDRELDLATATRRGHEREVESLGWLARHGHLTGLELEATTGRPGGGAGADRYRPRTESRAEPGLRRRQAARGVVGGRECCSSSRA